MKNEEEMRKDEESKNEKRGMEFQEEKKRKEKGFVHMCHQFVLLSALALALVEHSVLKASLFK